MISDLRRSECVLTQVSVLIVIPVVHAMLLELSMMRGCGCQMARCQGESNGSSLWWSPGPGAAKW